MNAADEMLDRTIGQEVTIRAAGRPGRNPDAPTEDNDEDGLKCAEALYNLANAGAVKLADASEEELISSDCIALNPIIIPLRPGPPEKPASKKVRTT